MRAANAQSVPQPPSGVMASISGTTVTMRWAPPAGGAGPVVDYVIEAGSTPGAVNVGRFSVGAAPSAVATNVAAGTYYVRVRAVSAAGESAPSNEIVVTVGSTCSGLPTAPGPLVSSVSGPSVQLSWGGSAGTVFTYIFEIGSRAGATDLGTIELGTTGTSYRADGVAGGTYFVRVRARNACGLSAPSNDNTVIVAGSTPSGGSQLQVRNSNAYIIESGSYAGHLMVAGEVTNTGGTVASLVRVGVEYFSSDGTRLGGQSGELVGTSRRLTASQQISDATLGPGETGCFARDLGDARRIGRHEIQVESESFPTRSLAAGPLDASVTWDAWSDYVGGPARLRVSPKLVNRGVTPTVWNSVAFVAKDSVGRVATCGSIRVYGKSNGVFTNADVPGYGFTNVLLPGETAYTLTGREFETTAVNANSVASVKAWPQWKE